MAYYTTNITIFRDEFTNPILHDEEWCMMLWRYYCKCCTAITTFIMKSLRSIWTIEFATIIRDATTKLNDDFDVDMFFAFILIYGSIIFGLVWIAVFVTGLLGSIATTKDTTKNYEDPTKNKNPIKNAEADEQSLPSLPTGAVSTDTTPPPLVSEPTGPHTTIEQLYDI